MDALASFIPMDRRQALARGESLPARTSGTALFAAALAPVFTALVAAVHAMRAAS